MSDNPLTGQTLGAMIRKFKRLTSRMPTKLYVTEDKFKELMESMGLKTMHFLQYFDAFWSDSKVAIKVHGLLIVPVNRVEGEAKLG